MKLARKIVASDIDLICVHRERMFLEAGKDPNLLKSMAPTFKKWLRGHLNDQTYYGFVIEGTDGAIGSIGMMTLDWPPHPEHPDEGHRGYVLNLFIENEYRKKGYASKLMSLAAAEFSSRGVSYVILHPTNVARPIYESLGWKASGEMIKQNIS